jgi:hypothetical protein
MFGALKAEFLKMKGARIPRMCAIGIAAFPALLAVPLTVLMKFGGGIGGSWTVFAEAGLAFIVLFVGPVLLGLIATFIFAREFVEGTARNLYALPISRTRVVLAKMLVLLCWSIAPAVLAFLTLPPLGLILGLPELSWVVLGGVFRKYALSGILIYSTLPLTCLVSMMSRGYIVPSAYTLLMTVVALFGFTRGGYAFWFPYLLPAALILWQFDVQSSAMAYMGYLILASIFLAGVTLNVVYSNRIQVDR